ncbi:MAG TPA: (2Fe-2S)-binding protein [Candidatus Limnocylindrales bacterium]|nr:(2Fe-2S)-binding protein [Candidatus Limnocylindrales bacterium]
MTSTRRATFTITFDGAAIEVEEGQTIAAALIAAGRRSWRTTRVAGAPRGAFCGIGVCFDCLATVNGRPNVRACLATARPGDAVTTQDGTGHADDAV